MEEGRMKGGSGDIKGPNRTQIKQAMKRPKPDPDLDDKPKGPDNEIVKEGFEFSLVFKLLIIIMIGYAVGSFVQWNIDKQGMKPQIVYEKGEEIVKYVEKSKTPTRDFLNHLNPDVGPELAGIIAKSIDESSQKYQLPRKLICSIIKNESNVNPFAKSNVGAVGLMQVMPKIHKEKINNRNLWHISVNIDVGCKIFKEYLDMEKGNLNKTFHRYLSKNATESQLNNYTSGIYRAWSKLEMYDYLSTQERHENENGNGDFTIHSEQTESQPVEPVHQTE